MATTTDPRAMGVLGAVRWWTAWRPLTTVVAGGGLLGFLAANALVTWWLRWLGTVAGATNVVRAAIAPTLGFLCLGVAAGAGVWLLGVREVNRRFPGGPEAFVDRHRSPVDPARVLVATDDDNSDGRFVAAPERVRGVSLSFESDGVTVREVVVDVVDRRIRLAGDERPVPDDRIEAVETDGDVVVEIDGERYRRAADTDADDPLRELRARTASGVD